MPNLDEKYYFKKTKDNRASGLLMHISSLPGEFGIGGLGQKAREFIDFLDQAGQTYWQMLPVGPTGYGDSPYQSFSTYAGNPYFIDLADLIGQELVDYDQVKEITTVEDDTKVDYGKLYTERYEILRIAFSNFDKENEEFKNFNQENSFWLRDYALFMSIKDKYDGGNWLTWPDELKYRNDDALNKFEEENFENYNFHRFTQFLFFKQWKDLKEYAAIKGIQTIGDLPIYVAPDSSDVWANPKVFQLNDDLSLKFVGGCPPDAFSDLGQLWGNPVYDWDYLEETEYEWWVQRMRWSYEIFDCIRIDHFRGFESYWSIPAEADHAGSGSWQPGPANKLFAKIKEKLGDLPVIAEDLGFMTEEVYNFRLETGYPSMKVLQFAFDPAADSDYLPHNYDDNCVVYTGTHDNDTILGWLEYLGEQEKALAAKYFNITAEEGFTWGLIRGAMTSVANTAIFQMQDLLGLDNSARMNNPGTLGINWMWRMEDGKLTSELADRLRELSRISGRLKQ